MPDAHPNSSADVEATLDLKQRRWIDSMRELVDFLEARPDLIPGGGGERFFSCHLSRDSFTAAVRQLGTGRKATSGQGDAYFGVERDFGPHSLYVYSPRDEVCERVVVGTRSVEREVAVETKTETVEEEIVEWRCAPSILRPEGKP